MGDHDTERQKRLENDAYARNDILGGQDLLLDEDSIPWILNHIDCFVSQSRGNENVEEVCLCLHALFDGRDDDVWEIVGQAISNLQALEMLHIDTRADRADDDHDGRRVVPTTSWEILARILSHVRQKVRVQLDDSNTWAVEEVQALARAIRGHPTIIDFDSGRNLPYESMDSLYSALATLPALEAVELSVAREDEITLANPESLTTLLRVPSLRSVCFDCFSFTSALCRATANAFMEGTAVTKLEFRESSFSEGECLDIMVNGLSRNISVSCIIIMSPPDQAPTVPVDPELYNALAMALTSNSTIRDILFYGWCPDLSLLFSALKLNAGLRSLKVYRCSSMDESLCTAMQYGLGGNTTLERLELNCVHMTDDTIDLWHRAFSFLRTDKALKSLMIGMQPRRLNSLAQHGVTRSCLSAFCSEIAAMLQANASLESLSIQSCITYEVKAKEYLALVAALQHNTTLKSLNFRCWNSLKLTHDEDKQMASLLKKNYALQTIWGVNNRLGDVATILRLNKAGRRYLIEDGSSISKGVEVLSRVNNDINCVFLHLLENPRLCDRRAVETVSAGVWVAKSDSSLYRSGGKREQTSANSNKESRRRVA
jgi:hypothetical protein